VAGGRQVAAEPGVVGLTAQVAGMIVGEGAEEIGTHHGSDGMA
jgi:hypothetical protein